MHLPPVLETGPEDGDGEAGVSGDGSGGAWMSGAGAAGAAARARRAAGEEGPFLSVEEVDQILARAGSANRRNVGQKARYGQRRRFKETLEYGDYAAGSASGGKTPAAVRAMRAAEEKRSAASAEKLRAAESVGKMDRRKEFVLVDGYNIIFSWPELKALAETNIDSARLALQDALCDYQGYRGSVLIVVFDAYRVAGHQVEIFDYHNIHVVFTKEAQTADAYIEQFSHEHAKTDRVVVATSDGLEQVIVRSAGSELLSAQDLKEDLERRTAAAREIHLKRSAPRDTTMAEKLDALRKNLQDS
ncbi:MAG: NYN domain-containing protein [Stomatobaculum sp.]|nr:NYN domain-containing protein [Stomatobaculum sp.]